MRRPEFLDTFKRAVRPSQWVTAIELAHLLAPANMPPNEFGRHARDISRRLSNLERFGHLWRRRRHASVGGHGAPYYEYALRPLQRLKRKLPSSPMTWMVATA